MYIKEYQKLEKANSIPEPNSFTEKFIMDRLANIESARTKILYNNKMALNQGFENLKLNSNFEISKFKAQISEFEKKIKSRAQTQMLCCPSVTTLKISSRNVYKIYKNKLK